MRKPAEIVASIDDLLTNILVKIPIKPLTHFKLVSKQWFSIITSHGFCLKRNSVPNPARGVFLTIKDDLRYLYHYIPLYPNSYSPRINLRFTTSPCKTEILHSCNGLLLCCSAKSWSGIYPVLFHPDCSMYVYNPTTNSFATLPNFPAGSRLGAALVFDPVKSTHYKVALVVALVSMKGPTCQIQIYSSETGNWSSGGEIGMNWSVIKFEIGVYWNGSIHWLNRELSKTNSTIALRFHVDSQVLDEMPIPPVMRDKNYWENYYFGESCNHLHFIEPVLPRFNIYEMKRDYSEWFVKYQVDLTRFCADHDVFNNDFGQKYNYDICVFSLIRDENGGDSKLVLRIPLNVIKFNLVDGTSETLREFMPDRVYGAEDLCDGTYRYADERGLDYIQTLCNV